MLGDAQNGGSQIPRDTGGTPTRKHSVTTPTDSRANRVKLPKWWQVKVTYLAMHAMLGMLVVWLRVGVRVVMSTYVASYKL